MRILRVYRVPVELSVEKTRFDPVPVFPGLASPPYLEIRQIIDIGNWQRWLTIATFTYPARPAVASEFCLEC